MTLVKPGERKGDWIFITPISNLVLTKEIGYEIRIERVLFVHREKLPRIRRRLGLKNKISEFINASSFGRFDEFFKSSDAFAVVRQKGMIKEIEVNCYRLVKDAVNILAVSHLGYAKRRFSPIVAIHGEFETPRMQRAFLNTKNISRNYGGRLTGGVGNLALTGHWKAFQKEAFYFKLLKILNHEIKVKNSWRQDLRRAVVLIGKSLNSHDVATSFLWNMIALECLLTRQGDKYSDALPERIEAILGWVGFWSTRGYETNIRDIYKKRCEFVHRGERKNITKKDLLFTDDLLFNLLVNILNFHTLFQSKDDVIAFAEKVKAEHILGIPSRVRPKKLVYYSRRYTDKDLAEI